jgi:predicted porin
VTRVATCTAAAITATTPTQCQTITAAVDAADTKQKNTTLSATYDVGAAKLFGYYANREMSGTTVVKYTTYNVGATYTMGALTPFVSYSSGTLKNATATTGEPTATQFGASYALSKRTNAYLYQASYKDNLALTSTSYKASQTNLGIAHSF